MKKPAGASAPAGTFSLFGQTGGQPVRAAVTEGGLRIGRSHECDLTILDEEASRLHCVVCAKDGRVTVEDRSSNGTSVNGKKIVGVTELKAGDVLTIGKTRLTLQEETAQPAALPPEEAAAFKPGDMVDRYRIQRVIGRGGMGTVYEVLHTGLDLPRALKALTLPDDPAYAGFREKFLDEGKMLARLKHENITQVHDAAYDEKTRTLFFVMDLVLYDDGRPCTLADVAYDEYDVVSWFASLASALDYIHGQGIVHSDIKLQNVLVSPGQKIKLADFGVAHLLSGKMRSSLRGDGAAKTDETVGYTAHYVAPEILKPGVMPSVASDVYALGVLLVRLLTDKWYDEHPTALAEIAAKRSLNWRPVLAQMLARDPKMRPTNLMKLVTQLRHGSKAVVRRKYQIENRRRRNQKIRLKRVTRTKAGGIQPTVVTPKSILPRIVWGSVAAVALLATSVGLVRLHRARVAAERAEQAKVERLNAAQKDAFALLKEKQDAVDGRLRSFEAETGAHLREYGFVTELFRANVTGSTDTVTATRRNDTIGKYADVLKAIDGVRKALPDFQDVWQDFDAKFRYGREVEAVQAATGDFAKMFQEKADALEALCEGERRAWSVYGETKALTDAGTLLRSAVLGERRLTLEAVRQSVEAQAELKTAPELAAAKAKVEEGDRMLAGESAGIALATNCYADARACLTNGLERLRLRREERDEIELACRRVDEDVRVSEPAKLRQGQSSLTVVAAHVKDATERFAARWKADGRFESMPARIGECLFTLEAQELYWRFLANVLNRQHEGLVFATTPSGVAVTTTRCTYVFGWNEIFSSRKMDTRTKEKYRQTILGYCNVPTDRKYALKLLVGRWIVLKDQMPDLNDDEQQAERLVEALRADGSAAVLAWARFEFPDEFPAPEVSATSAPSLSAEDFPPPPPAPEADLSQERLVFFTPSQGLVLPVVDANGGGIEKCQRIKGTNKVRFHIRGGEICGADYGVTLTVGDRAEGESLAVTYEGMPGTWSYTPVVWLDNAFNDGKPLLLVRCQYQPN